VKLNRTAIFLTALTLGALTAQAGEAMFELPSKVGAHRGGKGLWPEATVYGLKKCAERWPDILLEGDVRVTKDGAVIMMHDSTVDRTTDGTGPVDSFTLEEIQALDAAYRFTPEGGEGYPLRGQGIRVPLLKDVLLACPDHKFQIETKAGDRVVEKTLQAIKEAGAEDRVLLASFSPAHMATLKSLDPDFPRCYDPATVLSLMAALAGDDWDSYEPDAHYLAVSPGLGENLITDANNLQRIQALGIPVQIHTVNKPEQIKKYYALGVDLVLSDYPDRCYAVLEEMSGE